jgi:ribosome-binding factor A
MVKDIRLKRLERVALERASQVVLFELADPRLKLVTVTRVNLAADLSYITIYWSVYGSKGDRTKAEHALRQAAPVVQREVAKVFHTRRSPQVTFEFDPSIEGAIHMNEVMNQLATERAAREAAAPAETPGETDAPAAPDSPAAPDTPPAPDAPADPASGA